MVTKGNPMTIAEMVEQYDFISGIIKIPEAPLAEPVCFDGESDGVRTTYREAKLYDRFHAELVADHDAQKAKVRNRRRADRKHPENKAERKKNALNRAYRNYGHVCEEHYRGKNAWFWMYSREGRKVVPVHEAEIIRNLREAEEVKSAFADMVEEPEHYVGKTTLTGLINRLWKQLAEMRKPYEQFHYCYLEHYEDFDGIYYTTGYYKPEYYSVLDDYQVLKRWANVLYSQKVGTETDYDPEDIAYFCKCGKDVYEKLTKECPEDDMRFEWEKHLDELEERMNMRHWQSLGELDDFLWENTPTSLDYDDDFEECE